MTCWRRRLAAAKVHAPGHDADVAWLPAQRDAAVAVPAARSSKRRAGAAGRVRRRAWSTSWPRSHGQQHVPRSGWDCAARSTSRTSGSLPTRQQEREELGQRRRGGAFDAVDERPQRDRPGRAADGPATRQCTADWSAPRAHRETARCLRRRSRSGSSARRRPIPTRPLLASGPAPRRMLVDSRARP